ncbi:kelch-like protein 33 [Chanos chanos]|uniref:Kelch-like protein 33 n=1 Tax=Chanos chanos TaxID=29144 RepID=A0A6J2VU46_CHACN|nr:kelch-like protein 33 [Chanos chanos]
MSREQMREKQRDKEKVMSVRDRMAQFQSSASKSANPGEKRKVGRRSSNDATPTLSNKKEGRTFGSVASASQPPPSKAITPPVVPSRDSKLHTYEVPSYCDSLFTELCRLRRDGLLVDCNLHLPDNSYKVHRLVLTAVSQTAEVWLRSGQRGLNEVNLSELEGGDLVTPSGLQALLDFAYYGEMGLAYASGNGLEEVLQVCRCLGAERLAQVCRTGTPAHADREKEKSLQMFRNLWERHVGCDVTLQAESGELFPAHRVVLAAGGDYFRALLCGGLRESGEEVVCLRGVAAWVLQDLLRFVYSGRLRLGWSNVWDLAEAAVQFQLQGALSLCLSFLQEDMDCETCLDTLALAEAYGLDELGRAAEDYTLAHFQSVSEGEKFRDLPCPLLQRLLERDSLCTDSELKVFNAVICWVEEDQGQRLPYLPRLLQKVRFPLMSPAELKEVKDCNLLTRSRELRTVLETVNNLLQGEQRQVECKPRSANQVLVLVGGDSVDEDFARREPNQCLWFAKRFLRGPGLIRTVEWKPLAQLPEPPRFRHCVCVLNNKLYILGGRKYYGALDILKSTLRFDPVQCVWECLPDMTCPRDYFAAVCVRGKVFVLGGNLDDRTCLDSVEYYTPEDNTWRLAQPLDTPLCGHAAAVMDGKIFVSGGCDSRLRCLSSLWLYDPSTGCSKLAPMATGAGRAGHVMLVLGGRLVVAGGLQPLWVGFGDQLQCEAYDPDQNSWTLLSLLPRPHLSPAATSLDGQLYVLGGSSADTACDTPWVHRYDPRQGCWDKLGAMPRPYADLAACTLQLPISLRG